MRRWCVYSYSDVNYLYDSFVYMSDFYKECSNKKSRKLVKRYINLHSIKYIDYTQLAPDLEPGFIQLLTYLLNRRKKSTNTGFPKK